MEIFNDSKDFIRYANPSFAVVFFVLLRRKSSEEYAIVDRFGIFTRVYSLWYALFLVVVVFWWCLLSLSLFLSSNAQKRFLPPRVLLCVALFLLFHKKN